MKKRVMKSFAIAFAIVGLGSGFTATEASAQTSCQSLLVNCVATANQNYSNGTYTFAQWNYFVNSACPYAYSQCDSN